MRANAEKKAVAVGTRDVFSVQHRLTYRTSAPPLSSPAGGARCDFLPLPFKSFWAERWFMLSDNWMVFFFFSSFCACVCLKGAPPHLSQALKTTTGWTLAEATLPAPITGRKATILSGGLRDDTEAARCCVRKRGIHGDEVSDLSSLAFLRRLCSGLSREMKPITYKENMYSWLFPFDAHVRAKILERVNVASTWSGKRE